MKPIKLHLGCGMKKIHGYVNIDALRSVNPDSVQDVFGLPKIKSGSVDLIYACHVLEHSNRRARFDALFRWFHVLKSGGIIRIAVPDIEAAMKWYLIHGSLDDVAGLLWGGQRNKYDFHGVGFDFNSLKMTLEAVGFQCVRRYDWRQTEHAFIDDYSQAYLPHMDKERGMLMSLNVQAIKP